MIGVGSFVALTDNGVLYIQEMYEDFLYNGELYEVMTVDEDDDQYEVDINGHLFWLKSEEIVE
jgi:hypothetical protein